MNRLNLLIAAALPFCAGALEIDCNAVKGVDLWGGRPAHPAVVNPVTGQDPARVISLRGPWEFQRSASFVHNNAWGGTSRLVDPKPWGRTIEVPACWEAQGIGEPGMSESWSMKGDDNPKPVRHIHKGYGYYRRKVAIPEAWKDQRIWLKVGGAKSVGWFYVDGRPVACVDNFCGTYKYEITDLAQPGKDISVAAVVQNDIPSRKGLLSAMHRWGGLYRDVELEATPQVFVDDAWVRGNFDEQAAEVHVDVEKGARVEKGERVERILRVTVEGQTVEAPLNQSDNIVKVPLTNFRPWSPEHPNLYTARVDLVSNGQVVQTRLERFGVRKLEVRGKEFYLNGKPFYFRGFGDDHVYPFTGITPADVNEHRKHLAIARRAGFNYVRLHTHTELPEYYEAADELGILVEAELPYYNDLPTEGQVFDPVRDVTELWRHFRRYPSFGIYSMGNEGSFGPDLDRALHRYVKAMDPDRLKINQDCHVPGINPPESSDFVGGPIKIWKRGDFDPERPFVTHEYMNLCAKLDSRLEPRFTGIWEPPVTRAQRADWLKKFGLDHAWGDRLQDAQHALQRVWQKRGVECARTDPFCDGFCYWTIVDVVVANNGTYSAQGLFNPLWEQKPRGNSADDFRVFNRPVGVFCDFSPDRRTFQAGEAFDVDVLAANYGEGDIAGACVEWKLAAEGKVLASGSCPCGDIALGGVKKRATVQVMVPRVAKNVKAKLVVSLKGGAREAADNSYDLWLFASRPARQEPKLAVADGFAGALKGRYAGTLPEARASEADVVIAPYGSELASDALARGQNVICLAQTSGAPNVSLGWWWMGSQVGTAFLDHPAFRNLPHAGVLDELFFRILKQGRALPFAGVAQEDMLAVGEGGTSCYLYLGQAKAGKGKALLAFGLDVLSDTAEGAALLDGMLDYVRSDAFAPAGVHEMPRMKPLNGWTKTVKAGDRATWPGPMGEMKLACARGLAGQSELAWETKPVPADVQAKPTFDIRFFGGMGYVQQPHVPFALHVNGEKALDIPEVTLKNAVWRQNGYVLDYVREPTTDEYGTFTLTVPSAKLVPGKPAVVTVVAQPNNSRRWFAVTEMR